MRERENGRARWGEVGSERVSVWRGVGNILQAALMAVLKTLPLRNGHDVVYHGRLCSHTQAYTAKHALITHSHRHAQAKPIKCVLVQHLLCKYQASSCPNKLHLFFSSTHNVAIHSVLLQVYCNCGAISGLENTTFTRSS